MLWCVRGKWCATYSGCVRYVSICRAADEMKRARRIKARLHKRFNYFLHIVGLFPTSTRERFAERRVLL